MIVTAHLCGPPGEASRRLLAAFLNTLKADNRFIISALLSEGDYVPETMWELHESSPRGCIYKPPTPEEANTPQQSFYCVADVLERGEFSCGDAAAYESAVLEEIYGIPTEVIVVPQGSYEYHALFVRPEGPVDPTEEWIKRWTASNGGKRLSPSTGANRWGAAA